MNRLPSIFSIAAGVLIALSGCANTQTKAWNHYEAGMLLVFDGYDPAQDKEDKVEKLYNKALEYNEDLPAVRASLGTYKAKKGDAEAAKALWSEEIAMHPESKKAMEIVLKENADKDVLKTDDKEEPLEKGTEENE